MNFEKITWLQGLKLNYRKVLLIWAIVIFVLGLWTSINLYFKIKSQSLTIREEAKVGLLKYPLLKSSEQDQYRKKFAKKGLHFWPNVIKAKVPEDIEKEFKKLLKTYYFKEFKKLSVTEEDKLFELTSPGFMRLFQLRRSSDGIATEQTLREIENHNSFQKIFKASLIIDSMVYAWNNERKTLYFLILDKGNSFEIALVSLSNSREKLSFVSEFIFTFLILLVLVFSFFFILFYSQLIDRKNQSIQLEQAIEDRTEEFNKAVGKEKKSRKIKEGFLANMSHEIRTPMNGVMAMVEFLKGSDKDESQDEIIETLEYCGKNLLAIINDILDISSIEKGKIIIERRPFDLHNCINKSIQVFDKRAQENKVDLILEIGTNVPHGIVSDEIRLSQILSNLISNAIKFTKNGTITVKCRTFLIYGPKALLHFAVEDTGIGRSPENLKNIFKASSQAESSIKRNFGGTGLGLAISKKILERMGGELWVESEEGKGSKFQFTLTFMPFNLSELKDSSNHLSDTANVLPEIKKKCELVGIKYFVEKPIKREKIESII